VGDGVVVASATAEIPMLNAGGSNSIRVQINSNVPITVVLASVFAIEGRKGDGTETSCPSFFIFR